ncbi:MAG: NADP-dependent phosphogluconate dehydrogenase [Abditibacteriales bacterium]|nr:NADP-dependent phosphogluconate dehydrogenase [Abditibacteriales bacterium]MDW8368231.1 NADP-dependent phosphogluconate dehydrogenase [Abditibacteriales bacterium]
MSQPVIGLIGLAVMGENLALNIESKGFPIAVFNRTTAKTMAFVNGRAAGKNVVGTTTIEEFVNVLERPRRIVLMVKAGEAVDAFITQLLPHLEAGDILIDGGNSFFRDTERRIERCREAGVHYFGMGVSGGEEGALHGPSLMPGGGTPEAYAHLEPILTKIAAQVDDGACVTYIGPKGAGHFVKMVHNGIEYGDMQLIAEAYDLLRHAVGLSPDELHDVFAEWNRGELQSFLIEITARIVNFKDEMTGKPLVDVILDKAEQKGTGKWTSQIALDLGVPIPTITAAVDARFMSAHKAERVAAARLLSSQHALRTARQPSFINRVRAALYASKVCSYAQGFALLRAASREFGYNLNFSEIARIWKGGCIIRAVFLDRIKQAFARNPELPNLLVDDEFREAVAARQEAWRDVVSTAVELGYPVPAMSASLAYFDAYRRERLPANLIQAQRDLFGAHTYERVDREGVFHTEWGAS